jgi:hypothetical protein
MWQVSAISDRDIRFGWKKTCRRDAGATFRSGRFAGHFSEWIFAIHPNRPE